MGAGAATRILVLGLATLALSVPGAGQEYPSASWESSPVAIDWNGDDVMDLLVGDDDGFISLFLGIADDPLGFNFAGLLRVEGSGEPLRVPREAHPEATDWNGDGIIDLVVGDDVGFVTLFLGRSPGGMMVSPGMPVDLANGIPLRVHAEARPRCIDWNGDGAEDLIVGTNSDGLYIFLNTGSSANRLLSRGIRPRSSLGGELRLSNPVIAPWVGDWNGDGLLDLIIGCSVVLPEPDSSSMYPCCEGSRGHVFYYQNVGSVNSPLFDEGVQLEAASQPIDVGDSAAPYAFDWTGDGLLDLIVGSNSGAIWFFERAEAESLDMIAVPDQDGDGIPDPHDICPHQAGEMNQGGC